MTTILAVDPGDITGVAIATELGGEIVIARYEQLGRKYRRRGKYVVEPCTGDLAAEYLRSTAHACDRVMVVEGQFIPSRGGRGQRERAQAVATLGTAQHAGGWKYLARSYGLTLWGTETTNTGPEVPALTWRRAVYGRSLACPPAAQAVQLAVQAVAARYQIKLPPSQEHAAEAILLAGYALTEIRLALTFSTTNRTEVTRHRNCRG